MFAMLFVALSSLFACDQRESKKEIVEIEKELKLDIDKELEAIEETRSGFQNAIKEKRYQDLGQYATLDIKAVSPGSSDWLEWKNQREKRLGKFSYDSIIMTPQETVIANDSLAYDYGTSTVYYTNDKGESIQLHDTFLVILKKDKNDGKWKIHREVASSIVD